MNNKKRVQKLYISISHLPIIKSPSSNFLFDLTKTHEPQASIHIFMHLSFTEMYKTLNRKPATASQDQLLMTLNSCFKRLFQGTTINALSICTHKIMLSHPLQRQTTGYSPLDVKKISKHKTSLHELHTRPPHKFWIHSYFISSILIHNFNVQPTAAAEIQSSNPLTPLNI